MVDPQSSSVPPSPNEPGWQQVAGGSPYANGSNGYVPGQYPPPPQASFAPAPTQGLSDAAAGAIAYITIIPAIVFIALKPYNQRPFVRFNAIQCLLLWAVGFVAHLLLIMPILGLIAYLCVMFVVVILWVLCLVSAATGSVFKVPVLGNIAAQNVRF